jgi:hypothetical protein
MNFDGADFDVSGLVQAFASCFDGLGRAEDFNAGLEAGPAAQTRPGPSILRVGVNVGRRSGRLTTRLSRSRR